MCGYDPFYWYEKDLDDEYKERMEAKEQEEIADAVIFTIGQFCRIANSSIANKKG